MSQENGRSSESVALFRHSVLTLALVISSILVTSLKLAFHDPAQQQQQQQQQRRQQQRQRKGATGATSLTARGSASSKSPASSSSSSSAAKRGARSGRRRSRLRRNNSLDCIHEAVPAALEDQGSNLDVPLASVASAVALPPTHSGNLKARSQSDLTLRRTSSIVSDTSSEGTAGTGSGRQGVWAMEEVCGHLHKQSDVFGLWKQRFFRLAAFEPYELQEFPALASEIVSSTTHRRFVLLYWSCDAHMAMTGRQRVNPRGAFLLGQTTVRPGSDAGNKTLVLHNLVNAMDPGASVPPMNLSASDARGAHRWMSALTFADMAESLPRTGFDQLRTYPMPDMCDTLGVLASPATGQVLCKFYFRLYRAYASPAAAAAAAARGDEADDAGLDRVYLLSWDSEKQAVSKPIAAQSIYELTGVRVTVTDAAPGVLIIQGVKNLLPMNMHRSNGKLYLEAPSTAAAQAWARAVDPNCRLPEGADLTLDNADDDDGAAQDNADQEVCLHDRQRATAADTGKRRVFGLAAERLDELLVDELDMTFPSQEPVSAASTDASSPGAASQELEVDSLSASDILSMQQHASLKVEDDVDEEEDDYDDDDDDEEEEEEEEEDNNFGSDDCADRVEEAEKENFASPKGKPSLLNSQHLQSWQSPRPEKLSPVVEEAETPGSTTSRASRASYLARIR